MKITDEIRQAVIEARQNGESKMDTVKRMGLSESSYGVIVQAYRYATEQNQAALDKLAASNGPTVKWAIRAAAAAPAPQPLRLFRTSCYELYDAIMRSYGSGKTTRYVAQENGCSPETCRTVRRYAARAALGTPFSKHELRINKTVAEWAMQRANQSRTKDANPAEDPAPHQVGPLSENQELPKINSHAKFMAEAHLFPNAKDALFSRLHFLCELVDQAYFSDDEELLWRLHFILDALRNEVASFENAMSKQENPKEGNL